MGNKKALLFINGNPPEILPKMEDYDIIACTDGAFHYLEALCFPFEKLTFISGDFDSNTKFKNHFKPENYNFEIIFTPNQDKTDFEKALENLVEKGMAEVDIYGGSGGEMDHFLGNLTVAYRFKNKMKLKFFDAYSEYFFVDENLRLIDVKNRMISLYPFPAADGITTKGLNWELTNTLLEQHDRIGTRNFAVKDEVSISFKSGALLVFIGQNYT